ncbi:protein ALTERED SEED GERMINATION 2-like isoform X2 [Zingiber officinale]|uniref:protein ALTERED SEED GERMINATION 2-like isoform X2 n=1 Tax=Zingiber officinale TaxID=94328 RepID=UPI001C4B43C9|nr:protein ALTERED SEED GERMINATION 2-like isoform X2 [Zingiber officinale]XP_042453686.1 protein ALTERED SEED GERMINATION 2-like isoform X2 [Zingiber officinale]
MPNSEVEMQMHVNNSLLLLVIRVETDKVLYLLLDRNIPFYDKKLNKHNGCVNTVSLNENGNILVSGSDDQMVILWDWEVGTVRTSFHSGHKDNVFQARFMPCTAHHQTIVTSAADGEVRLAQLREGGQVTTELLAEHDDAVHKVAFELQNPHVLYSGGEDGLVQHFDLRSKNSTKLFICRSFRRRPTYTSFVNLMAISIDPRNPNYLAVAGADDYARVYDIRKYKWDGSTNYGLPCENFCPAHLIDHSEGISGLCFSDSSELLVSYMNEYIYLFPKDQGLGSNPVSLLSDSDSEGKSNSVLSTSNASLGIKLYKGHCNRKTVKDVNFFGPYCDYVVSGSDCGRIFIWRKKDGILLRAMKGDRHVVNCTVSHPHTTMLASSGIEKDVKIWVPNTTHPFQPVNLDEGYDVEDLENDDDSYDTDFSDSDDGTEEDVFADGVTF